MAGVCVCLVLVAEAFAPGCVISQAIEFALYSVNLADNLQPKDLMAAFNAVRTLRKPPECSARCWKLLVCTTYLQIAYLAS